MKPDTAVIQVTLCEVIWVSSTGWYDCDTAFLISTIFEYNWWSDDNYIDSPFVPIQKLHTTLVALFIACSMMVCKVLKDIRLGSCSSSAHLLPEPCLAPIGINGSTRLRTQVGRRDMPWLPGFCRWFHPMQKHPCCVVREGSTSCLAVS